MSSSYGRRLKSTWRKNTIMFVIVTVWMEQVVLVEDPKASMEQTHHYYRRYVERAHRFSRTFTPRCRPTHRKCYSHTTPSYRCCVPNEKNGRIPFSRCSSNPTRRSSVTWWTCRKSYCSAWSSFTVTPIPIYVTWTWITFHPCTRKWNRLYAIVS